MDSNTSEYIFWLRNWRDPSISFWPKTGQIKCTLTKSKLSLVSLDHDPTKELNVALSLIRNCRITPRGKYSNQTVEILLDARKISLSPVTPFDPKTILIGNRAEAYALRNAIESMRTNVDPQMDGNPYMRQLAAQLKVGRFDGPGQLMKQEIIRLEKLNQNWDAHVSPWAYFECYGDKFLYLKTVAKVFALALFWAVIATLATLILAYVLDILNII